MTRIALIGLVVSILCGCHYGVPAPDGWVGRPSPAGFVVGDGDPIDQARLQVLIHYGYMYSNHSTLRLICPGQPVLFWDPGGTYGDEDPTMGRNCDLLLTNPPTVEQWWAYRNKGCNEPIMAVFEWGLPDELARRLHTTLLNGTDENHPQGTFHSDIAGWACCVAICDFLMRFASDRLAVPRTWMLPRNLGRHLWTQSPDRVHIFRADKPTMVYEYDPRYD